MCNALLFKESMVDSVRDSCSRAGLGGLGLKPWVPGNLPPVAAIAPATILAATAGAAERCDVWEGLSALSPPVKKKMGS